jgi:hypothetical protein
MPKLLSASLACATWLIASAAGFVVLMNYQTAQGVSASAPNHWPANTSLDFDSGRDNLVMFVHPKCPCTRATMEELNRILARANPKPSVRVLFYKPSQASNDWTDGALWQTASSMPGVQVMTDTNGKFAKAFGATTSGYVLFYNPKGDLLFRGGITPGRDHAGDNAGEDAISDLLLGKTAAVSQTPVYGCSLAGVCAKAD